MNGRQQDWLQHRKGKRNRPSAVLVRTPFTVHRRHCKSVDLCALSLQASYAKRFSAVCLALVCVVSLCLVIGRRKSMPCDCSKMSDHDQQDRVSLSILDSESEYEGLCLSCSCESGTYLDHQQPVLHPPDLSATHAIGLDDAKVARYLLHRVMIATQTSPGIYIADNARNTLLYATLRCPDNMFAYNIASLKSSVPTLYSKRDDLILPLSLR